MRFAFFLIFALITSTVLIGCQTSSSAWDFGRNTSDEPPSDLLALKRTMSAEDLDLRALFEKRNSVEVANAQQVNGGMESGAFADTTDKRSDVVTYSQGGNSFIFSSDPLPSNDATVVENQQQAQEKFVQNRKVKVGILLPLSGQHKAAGQSLLNAAQLALVDVGVRNFELVIRDTKGAAEGAHNAAQSAISKGASLILGPLFSAEVAAVKPLVRQNNMNMIAFSTDWSLADDSTYLIGFMPFAQVAQIVSYASEKGYRRLGVIAPYNDYGNAVLETARQMARRTNMSVTQVARYRMENSDLNETLSEFTDFERRSAARDRELEKLESKPKSERTAEEAARLKELKRVSGLGELPFDAVLLAAGGGQAKNVASLLAYYDVDLSKVKLLGTGLFDDATLGREPSMVGAWYAAPSMTQRGNFETDYRDVYGENPIRLASLAYDATALAAVLALSGVQQRGIPAYDRHSITNPNGFAGVDGVFRFKPNGLVERAQAVLEIRRTAPVEILGAPKTFQAVSAQAE